MPPYICTDDEIATICAAIRSAAVAAVAMMWEDVAGRPGRRARERAGLRRSAAAPRRRRRRRRPGRQRLPRAVPPPRGRRGRRRGRRAPGAPAPAPPGWSPARLELHADLEAALADFPGQPAALVFSTGYHANLAAVTALADRDTLIVSDAHIHASLVDACRLARAEVTVVPHNDVAAVVAPRSPAPAAAGRWCWSSRSTPCSATPRRSLELAGRLRVVRRAAGRRRGARARRGRRRRPRAGRTTSASPGSTTWS